MGVTITACTQKFSAVTSLMSFQTLKVEIDHGRIVSTGAEALPEKAAGLLTILRPLPLGELRPIGLAQGQFIVPDDFNNPLPEDLLLMFQCK
jgi:hypothetical protein